MPKHSSNPLDRFQAAEDAYRYRLIGASVGEVGTGKTHFWLTAPGPIVIFSLDRGLEGVVEPFVREGKEIRICEYDWSPTADLEQSVAIDIRDQLIDDYEFALQHARTILWDKETDIWELFRYAEFGKPNDEPRNYPQLNQRYRRLINMPKALDVNFGCIQGLKDRWVSKPNPKTGKLQGHNTGERERQGFSELAGLVHLDLTHRREGGTFYIDVGKSRGPGARDVQDQTFENFTFAELGQLIFPESTEGDWQ